MLPVNVPLHFLFISRALDLIYDNEAVAFARPMVSCNTCSYLVACLGQPDVHDGTLAGI